MVELEWEAKRSSARFAERAQQMAGSFNRLLAKAPKRRLTRRGGAWQEGDFPFRGCFEKKNYRNGARGEAFRVSGFWASCFSEETFRFFQETTFRRLKPRIDI